MPIIATRENSTLLLEMKEGGNAFTHSFLNELSMWLTRASQDMSVRAVVLTSASKVFSVGGDLSGMERAVAEGDPARYVREIVPAINKIIVQMCSLKKPIITALNGTAAGGAMSLFLAGDIRITSEKGKLFTAFANLGLSPDSGSSILIAERTRLNQFKLFATASTISAEILLRCGGADEVVPHDNLLSRAMEVAQSFEGLDPWAVGRSKMYANRNVLSQLEIYLNEEYEGIMEASKREGFVSRLKSVVAKVKK